MSEEKRLKGVAGEVGRDEFLRDVFDAKACGDELI
jgi:hypothetical protein